MSQAVRYLKDTKGFPQRHSKFFLRSKPWFVRLTPYVLIYFACKAFQAETLNIKISVYMLDFTQNIFTVFTEYKFRKSLFKRKQFCLVS